MPQVLLEGDFHGGVLDAVYGVSTRRHNMATFYFGMNKDCELVWFKGEDVKEVRQLEEDESGNREYAYTLELISGQIYHIADMAVIQYTGEITKIIDLYDRANRIKEYLKEF